MLKIYGESDDLVYMEGIGEMVMCCPTCKRELDQPAEAVVGSGSEEFGTGYFKVIVGDEKGGVVIIMRFDERAKHAPWSAEILVVDEDVLIPWAVTVKSRNHSALVEIDAPDGTPLKWVTVG